MHVSQLTTLLKEAASEWIEDNALRLSAAVAYYMFLSLTPLILIVIAIAGVVYGEHAAADRVSQEIQRFAGDQAGNAMLSLVQNAHQAKGTTTIALLGGTIVLLFGASCVFGELKSAMDTIWGVVARPGQAMFTLLWERLLSFAVVLVCGIIMVLSLAASAALSAIEASVHIHLSLPHFVLQFADFSTTFAITAVLFVLLFMLLPDVKLHWGDVWMSGVGTAFLFTIGKLLLGIYLGTSGIASSYGAAGSVIIIQLWVYYSACILFFGVETAKVITRRRRGAITPRRNAVRREDLMRAQFQQPPEA